MRIAICTLCLNEEEFLWKSYEQHKDWPGLIAWCFVEAADPLYAHANPKTVTPNGLSVDATSEILNGLADKDNRVQVDHFGWMTDFNRTQNKTRGRDRYLDVMEQQSPDAFLVLDADEFYTHEDQQTISKLLDRHRTSNVLSWRFRQRHLWRPPNIEHLGQFHFEAVGGYWSVPHTRLFRWRSGLRYRRDHNWPEAPQWYPLKRLSEENGPQCIHMGFARTQNHRRATNRYYRERGEGRGDGRGKYVECRTAWETWTPETKLPAGARVIEYHGPIPECYQST